MKINTTTLLIGGAVLVGAFLLLSKPAAQKKSGTGFGIGFNEDGSVSDVGLELGFLDDIFGGFA